MGEVYKARDTRLERTVAVNLLAPFGRESMIPATVVVNWNAGLSR